MKHHFNAALPQNYKYEIIEFKGDYSRGGHSQFIATILTDLNTVDDVKRWINDFEMAMNCGFVLQLNYGPGFLLKENTGTYEKHLFLQRYVCTVNKSPQAPSDCPAGITITKTANDDDDDDDDDSEHLSTEIVINWKHTHDMYTTRTLPFANPTNVKFEFFSYFERGLGIDGALRAYEKMLRSTLPHGLARQCYHVSKGEAHGFRALWWTARQRQNWKDFLSRKQCLKAVKKEPKIIRLDDGPDECILDQDDEDIISTIGHPLKDHLTYFRPSYTKDLQHKVKQTVETCSMIKETHVAPSTSSTSDASMHSFVLDKYESPDIMKNFPDCVMIEKGQLGLLFSKCFNCASHTDQDRFYTVFGDSGILRINYVCKCGQRIAWCSSL